ncbi:MAG: AraC family transcriptional regulator [Spirochaetota bacterium]
MVPSNFSLLDYSILGFGGLFCVIWSLGLALAIPGKVDRAAIYFVAISGMRLLWEAFTLSGFAAQSPLLYALAIPFLYLIGPSILLYYERLAGREEWRLHFVHFIPLLLAFSPLLYWFALDSQEQATHIKLILQGVLEYPNILLLLWVVGPKISIFLYSLATTLGRSAEGVAVIRMLPQEIRFFAFLLLGYIWCMIVIDICGYFLGVSLFYRWSAYSHALAAVLVFLYSRRNPSAMLHISGAIQKARYVRSKLAGVDVKQAVQQLNRFMQEEAYFADEDLRLARMAEVMGLTSHQLSELINSYFQMSFVSYTNSHRILAACNMLCEENRTILSVAFAVGFNSKSAFNRVFKQILGVSPGEFRKQPQQFAESKMNLQQTLRPNL